jgi:23S rRNA (cytosine1962-C5)-methyltransferase
VSGKEANAIHRHPWIFSRALAEKPENLPDGSLVRVADSKGRIVGVGSYTHRTSIAVRLYAFEDVLIDRLWLARRIAEADARRQLMGYGPRTETTGYRVVFGEADGLPGIVIDRYANCLVLQISTAGAELLRNDIAGAITDVFPENAIAERSEMSSRLEEGLEPQSGMVLGTIQEPVPFTENGLKFLADPLTGQKTGFYLDQKDLRAVIRRVASGRRVLNLFSYTGAAGVAALAGGASHVLNVDSSQPALDRAKELVALNGFGLQKMDIAPSDVFQFLNEERPERYGMVIIDPPAIIKSLKDGEDGRKAYHFLNRAALRLVEDNGIFVTSSCSHYLPEEDLAFILRRASVQAGVRLDILSVIRQPADHPASVYFPESAYLKSFVCQVHRNVAV